MKNLIFWFVTLNGIGVVATCLLGKYCNKDWYVVSCNLLGFEIVWLILAYFLLKRQMP
jgi:hypothetical protein